jgi:hypothetical protein
LGLGLGLEEQVVAVDADGRQAEGEAARRHAVGAVPARSEACVVSRES